MIDRLAKAIWDADPNKVLNYREAEACILHKQANYLMLESLISKTISQAQAVLDAMWCDDMSLAPIGKELLIKGLLGGAMKTDFVTNFSKIDEWWLLIGCMDEVTAWMEIPK